MTIQRRTLLSGAVALSASALSVPETFAAEAPAWQAPTDKRPILACFNENPLGLSPAARKAVADSAAVANRYPFARAEVMRKACAEYVDGKPEAIVLAHGSAEALRASIEAYRTEGTRLVIPELTYGDAEMCANRNGIPVVKVKMGPNWSVDLDAMKKTVAAQKAPTIVYLPNPNNPTGTLVSTAPLFDWIRSAPKDVMFLLDEAYVEFVDDPDFKSAAELVAEGAGNVVVLRTFSKVFAMAGLRLGFAYAEPSVAKKVREHIAYDIFMCTPAVEAGLAEIKDAAFIRRSIASNAEAKRILLETLDELKLEYLPTQTNFVFVNLRKPLAPFVEGMKAAHVMVGRPFPPADGWCRISFTLPEDMRYVAQQVKAMREKGLC